MKKTTLDFIQKLTKNDTKTLLGKALKVAEEAGELASEVLPFEGAHGTTHRFSTKEKILEEVADVFLASISVALDVGLTYEDFEEMVERKTLKWAELQRRHNEAKYPVPYEIHISVKNVNQEAFRQVCKALDVKPIVLALQVGEEELEDVMTSSKHYGDNTSAYNEMRRISDGLRRANFNVVREKIETVPWHPAAPSDQHANPTMPKDCYFESHIGVFVENEQQKITLKDIADQWPAHLSRNAFKVMEDGYVQMITLRKYSGTYEAFKQSSKMLFALIQEQGFKVDNMITEFSIYDTKISHDSAWIQK